MADPKQIVADGYDRIAAQYIAWTGRELAGLRARYLGVLEAHVPAGGSVLELGCATGVPVTRALTDRYRVTGVDISPRHIELARTNVPSARFVQADMTALDLPESSFDAALAFYAITHVPREEHAPLLAKIKYWLRPGGLFVATLGAGDDPGTVEDDWLGAPMYFSSYDAPTSKRLVTDAGFELLSAEEITELEDGAPVTFLWVVARKPFHRQDPIRRTRRGV